MPPPLAAVTRSVIDRRLTRSSRRQLQDQARPAFGRSCRQSTSVAQRNRRRDCQPAPAAPLPTTRPPRKLPDRRRQPRPVIRHLDADPSLIAPTPDFDDSPAVLDRIGDQVAQGLGQAKAIAPNVDANDPSRTLAARRLGRPRPVATPRPSRTRAARGRPARAGATSDRPRPRGLEIVERQRGLASSRSIARSRAGDELARCRRRARVPADGRQRPAQLVARPGDGLHSPGGRSPHPGCRESGGARREPPPELDRDHRSTLPSMLPSTSR